MGVQRYSASLDTTITNAFEMNFFSNGFKIITTDTALNQNGEGYLYLAFAEEPFVASNEVPATAR